MAGTDAALDQLAGRLAELAAAAADIGGELAGYEAQLEADPARLAGVHERRAALTALIRKYGAGDLDARCWTGRPRPSSGWPTPTPPTRRWPRWPPSGTARPADYTDARRARCPGSAGGPPAGCRELITAELAAWRCRRPGCGWWSGRERPGRDAAPAGR